MTCHGIVRLLSRFWFSFGKCYFINFKQLLARPRKCNRKQPITKSSFIQKLKATVSTGHIMLSINDLSFIAIRAVCLNS